MRFFLVSLAVAALCLSGCSGDTESTPVSSEVPAPISGKSREQRTKAEQPTEAVTASPQAALSGTLRMAVTTSTYDTGLLDDLLKPEFEKLYPEVDLLILPKGTGAALRDGEDGNVDVVLVHARAAEDAFMKAEHGIRREDVMYNSFEILGPPDDPAGIKGMSAPESLQKIAEGGHPFVSRGDDSGTHKREVKLWEAGGGRPEWDQYFESGAGMGATLTQADERQAYTLSDRGTYLNRKSPSSNSTPIDLVPLAAQSEDLRNPYGIMVVNPEKSDLIREGLAQAFVDFIISAEIQTKIQDFKVSGEQLFYPLKLPKQNEDSNEG